jgi:ketosteroid isomerase-like protein
MSDAEEIGQIRALYAQHFDARDAAAFVTIFTADATIVVPGGKEITGHERLARLVERTPPGGTHIPVAAEIAIDGDQARCAGPYRLATADGEQTGHYRDEFVRTAAGWRFSRRAILPDG